MNYSDVHKKISEMKNQTFKKTKDMSETKQLSTALRTEEERQKELLLNMGQVCYDKGLLEETEEVKELYESITACRERMREYKDRLRILKGSVICPMCGNAVKSDEKFCSRCGNDMTKETVAELQHTVNEEKGSGFDIQNMADVKDFPFPLFIASIILQLLLVILWFVKSISINAFGMEAYALSPHMLFAESDASMVSFITIILCIGASGKTIYTLLYRNSMHRCRMRFQIGVSVWCLLVELLVLISVISVVHTEGKGLADFTIAIGGWIYLIDCIALVVILIKISKEMKAKKSEENKN